MDAILCLTQKACKLLVPSYRQKILAHAGRPNLKKLLRRMVDA